MSLLIKAVAKRKLIDSYQCLCAIQSRKGHWYPYYKPGPYPKTKEEREAAAKKYNLLPEEYEPYPDNSMSSLGDYPKLPKIPVDCKDPWYAWDDQEFRRSFNEPLHCDQMTLLPENSSKEGEIKEHIKGAFKFFTFCVVVVSIFCLIHSVEIVRPVMEKQYPTPGVTHYSFDLDMDKHKH